MHFWQTPGRLPEPSPYLQDRYRNERHLGHEQPCSRQSTSVSNAILPGAVTPSSSSIRVPTDTTWSRARSLVPCSHFKQLGALTKVAAAGATRTSSWAAVSAGSLLSPEVFSTISDGVFREKQGAQEQR